MSHAFSILEVKSDEWLEEGLGYKWPNLPVVKRFRVDHITKGRQKRMPNRQVAVGIDNGQVHLSRAEQGKQRTPESSWRWRPVFRAEDRSNDGKPDGFHRRTNFSSEWSGDTLCATTKHYTLWNFTLLSVRGGCTNSPELVEIGIFKTALQSNRF